MKQSKLSGASVSEKEGASGQKKKAKPTPTVKPSVGQKPNPGTHLQLTVSSALLRLQDPSSAGKKDVSGGETTSDNVNALYVPP